MTTERAFHLFQSVALAPGTQVFRPFRDGIEKARLFFEPAGAEVALLRYRPGAQVPLHVHAGYEYVLVLEGAQEDQHGRYAAGSLVVNSPGSQHAVRSEEGCLVLVLWQAPVRFVESPDSPVNPGPG